MVTLNMLLMLIHILLDTLPASSEEAAVLGHQVVDSSCQRKKGTRHAQQLGSRDTGSLQ